MNIVNAPSPGATQLHDVRLERAFAEMPALRHETKDVLKALEQNLQILEDLSGRLGFVLSDVRASVRR